jgi:hypothetical protein
MFDSRLTRPSELFIHPLLRVHGYFLKPNVAMAIHTAPPNADIMAQLCHHFSTLSTSYPSCHNLFHISLSKFIKSEVNRVARESSERPAYYASRSVASVMLP